VDEAQGPAKGDDRRERPAAGLSAAGRLSFRELLAIMREDWVRHDREFLRPGLHALLLHRYSTWRLGLPPGPRRKALSAIRHVLWMLIRNVYGIELQEGATIGRRVRIEHHGGVIVDSTASIGDDCLIQHNVTVGRAGKGGLAPRIGRDVLLGPGSIVVGDITVGDHAVIGPNAVVLIDVPPRSTACAAYRPRSGPTA
jgi:serine O-acetyltransferase